MIEVVSHEEGGQLHWTKGRLPSKVHFHAVFTDAERGIRVESRPTVSLDMAQIWEANARCHGMAHYEIECHVCAAPAPACSLCGDTSGMYGGAHLDKTVCTVCRRGAEMEGIIL